MKNIINSLITEGVTVLHTDTIEVLCHLNVKHKSRYQVGFN